MAEVTKTYDKIATHFNQTRRFLWKDFVYFDQFLANSQEILDLGCGNGRLVQLFEKYKDIKYLGIDSSKGLIDLAKENYKDKNWVRFENIDLLEMEKVEGRYDVIFLNAVWQHFPEVLHQEIIEKIKNLLKPNGLLMMTNWNLQQKHFLKFWIRFFLDKVKNPSKEVMGVELKKYSSKDLVITYDNKEGQSKLRYLYLFTKGYIKNILEKNNFSILKNEVVKDGKKSLTFFGKNVLTIAKKND